VLDAVASHIPKKWKNVQAVFIKSADSVALPFYQSLPEALAIVS
jgi:ribosome biogenesis protein UTP30